MVPNGDGVMPELVVVPHPVNGFKLVADCSSSDVDPCDDEDDDDEDEVADEQGAAIVVVAAVVVAAAEPDEASAPASDDDDAEELMCCCSFWAAKLRSTRLMEETCERWHKDKKNSH